jgi:hypothetical protein
MLTSIMKQQIFITLFALSVSLSTSAAEELTHTTQETLLARIQVEDFINDYYWELATIGESDLKLFWDEEAVFDVNGNIYEGLKSIEDVYSLGLGPGGRLIFQMDIPRIRILDNTATVDMFYTGFLNNNPDEAPKPYEQGHDHMELINSQGSWKITNRTLRSVSLDKSYE